MGRMEGRMSGGNSKKSATVQMTEFREVPTANLETSIGNILLVGNLMFSKTDFRKVYQLTLSSGGSEHVWILSVSIS